MQKPNKAETQRFSHYWGAWKMSPWVSFLSWWLTSVQWWRKGSYQAMTRCSALRLQAAQASWVQRPRAAFLTAPARCFSGGCILSACPNPMASATWQMLLGELLPHPQREDSAKEKERAQARPLGRWILREYIAKMWFAEQIELITMQGQ